ncbi:uncharacterized protein LOC124118869 [Haliotis rufescens]|uniref:uncharacterized protein LOC124118869 n=1 Tax=Haliotis rufescens TaxID=6454 RepID=UPI00201EE5FA|nr:uncharacterized protein LOC124118869 [Haliotis rufescens]
MFFASTEDDVYWCNITNCTSSQRLFLDKDGCDEKRIGLHRTQRVLYVYCQYADASHAILRMSFHGNDRKTFFTLNNPLDCAFVNQEGSYSYVYVCDQSSVTKYSLDGAAVKGFKIPVDKTGDLRERVCHEMVAGDTHIYTILVPII